MKRIKLAYENKPEEAEMRKVYCTTLMELAGRDPSIVALDADLINSIGMTPFAKEFPERMFNCGVQEANMMGVAAGLSATGKIPFVHTFGPFATRRSMDQVFLSCAYAKLNVKITGSDPGVTAEYNGGTHMPFEDMGVMRCIPEVTVMEPSDSVMLKNILTQIYGIYGVFYNRLSRKKAVKIYSEDSTFEIGKSVKLRDGKDATIIASGIMVPESLEAAELLEKENISVRVLDMFTWKPLDKEAVHDAARDTGAIVTAENHNVVCGLASAVAGAVVEGKCVPMEMIGVHDLFGQVGTLDYLKKVYGLTADDIVKAVKKAIARK
jgi:transketolase